MDWDSVASPALDQAGSAVLVLDGAGRIRLANVVSVELFGRDVDALLGESFVDLLVPEAKRRATHALLGRVRKGGVPQCRLSLLTKSGEADVPVATIAIAGALVLSIAPWVLADVQEIHDRPEVVIFEIDAGEGSFGTIRAWETCRPRGPTPALGDRCYRWLNGLSAPCPDCPCALLTSGRSVASCVVRRVSYEIETARVVGERRVRICLQRIDEPTRVRLFEAHVDALAARSGLSAREREVLQYLLVGAGVQDIASVLGVSPRTVRFHQANLLAKLGAESRADLTRLLL